MVRKSKSPKRSPSKAKYERCVQKVKAKQPRKCADQKWKGQGCTNPFAVCTKSTGYRKPISERKVYIGPRGGRYVMVKGVKTYI